MKTVGAFFAGVLCTVLAAAIFVFCALSGMLDGFGYLFGEKKPSPNAEVMQSVADADNSGFSFEEYGEIKVPVQEKGYPDFESDPAAIESEKYSFEQLASYLGVDPKITYSDSFESDEDIVNYLLLSAVRGDYLRPIKVGKEREDQLFEKDVYRYLSRECALALPELMGSYCNLTGLNIYSEGPDGMHLVGFKPSAVSLTRQQVYNRQIAAIDEALRVDEQLREAGLITDASSDMDKARIFAEYLLNLNVDPSTGGSCPPEENMYYDSAFSCLVQRVAACGGRAAGYNLLLRTEGIPCTAIGCTVLQYGEGHYINRMLLDGSEYYFDWYNTGFFPEFTDLAGANEVVSFYEGQLEFTQAILENQCGLR